MLSGKQLRVGHYWKDCTGNIGGVGGRSCERWGLTP